MNFDCLDVENYELIHCYYMYFDLVIGNPCADLVPFTAMAHCC